MAVELGLTACVTLLVSAQDTAVALHSGDVDVLATPRVVALAEEASVAAVHPVLPAGSTTVGSEVRLTHLAPTPVGGTVVAEAVLDAIEGRKLCFKVTLTDGRGLVAAGRVTRVVVERASFLERAAQ